MTRTLKKGTIHKCPTCGHNMNVIKTDQMTALTKMARYACTNGECGQVFRAFIQLEEVLIPSDMPDPKHDLPIADYSVERMKK